MDAVKEKLNVFHKFERFIEKLSVEQRWYCFSPLIGLVVLSIYVAYYLEDTEKMPPIEGVFFSVVLIAALGLVSFIVKVYEALSESIIWKGLFSLAFVVLVTLSLTTADGVVNSALRVPSSPFVYTQSIVAVLQVPVFTVAMSLVISAVAFVLVLFFFIVKWLRAFQLTPKSLEKMKTKNYVKATYLFRFGLMSVFVYYGPDVVLKNTLYDTFVRESAQKYAYYFEMESYTHCDVKAVGERFAYLDPNTIVVGIKQDSGYAFSVRPCKEMIAVEAVKKADGVVKKIRDGVSSLIGE